VRRCAVLRCAVMYGVGAALALAVAAPACAADSPASGTVTLAAYGGVFQDNYTKAVVEPFMKRFPGIAVIFYPFPNSAQMLGTLRAQKSSPQLDVVLLDVSIAKVGTDEALFAPLDPAAIPSLGQLYGLATQPGVLGRGVTFDHLTLLYNTKAVTPAPTSWAALWDAKLEGRIVIPGMPDIQGTAISVIANKLAGGGDPAVGLDKGFARMIELAPLVQSWDPRPDPYTLVINGTADMGVGWNARSQFYKDSSGGLLGTVLPQEGSVFQINVITLVAGSKNPKASETFINYALGTEAQKSFAETMFYAPTNQQAAISQTARERTAAGFMDSMIAVDWIAMAKMRDKYTEQWRRQVLPASR
jgi:putative spermidine/putrescine transport system substrate-binding protein